MMMQRNASHNRDGRDPVAVWMKVLPVVSAYVRSLILNYHDSEDVIHEIAVVFANKFPSLDASRDVVPWVLQIARYEVVNYIRRQGRTPQYFDEETLVFLEQAYQSLHDETAAIQSSLHECIQKLHDRPRHVLELRYFREMTIPEIARHLGSSSNAIYIMLCRVRAALAKCVKNKIQMEWKPS